MITVYVEAQPEDLTRYGFSPDDDGINEYWEIYVYIMVFIFIALYSLAKILKYY